MKVRRDSSESIGWLSAHRARVLIVGARALAAMGRPRATRLHAPFGEHTVGFLRSRLLIENKLATGRTKDRLDVELLREGEG